MVEECAGCVDRAMEPVPSGFHHSIGGLDRTLVSSLP